MNDQAALSAKAKGGEDTFQPLAERIISDVETLKAISDPVRLRILETMVTAADEAWTVKRLAKALDTNPTKLYHHINILEEREFIRVAGTRVVSGIIETSYRIAQLSLRLDRALLSGAGADVRSSVHDVLAVVFDSVADMAQRIDDPNLDVNEDDVLVMRNAGPIGAPGMPEAGYLPIPKKLAQKGIKDMVRISDARMSGTAFGTIVLHITPESAVGGPLALVRSGDMIRLDVAKRSIDLLVDEAELAKRRAALLPAVTPEWARRGYAHLFNETILQADEGCDFDFMRGQGKD